MKTNITKREKKKPVIFIWFATCDLTKHINLTYNTSIYHHKKDGETT